MQNYQIWLANLIKSRLVLLKYLRLFTKQLYELFVIKVDIHNVSGSFKVTMPKFRTIQYDKHLLSYEEAQIWNKLGDDIKGAINLNVFRRRIKKQKGPKSA